jgi:hypothetical protein
MFKPSSTWTEKQDKQLQKDLVCYVAEQYLPLATVDAPAFRSMIETLNLKASKPHRKALIRGSPAVTPRGRYYASHLTLGWQRCLKFPKSKKRLRGVFWRSDASISCRMMRRSVIGLFRLLN